jgi:transposase-like protein
MKKSFTSSDKAKIALEAVKEIDPLSKIGSTHGANPIQVGLWKKTLVTRSHELFDKTNKEAKLLTALREERDELHRLVGVREVELAWLKKKSASSCV